LDQGAGSALLTPRCGADGSFSLWSGAFGEGFHSAAGALSEAQQKFVRPSQLERWRPGQELVVVEVAVGTGTNTAALLQAAAGLGLPVQWWGLEQDRQPLALALASDAFRSQWSEATLSRLEALGHSERLLWGDGRQAVSRLPAALHGGCDLVWLDAFSPRRCPQLWSLQFLARLAALLKPEGRLITYSSAAAVRGALVTAGLQLASIASVGRFLSPALPHRHGMGPPVMRRRRALSGSHGPGQRCHPAGGTPATPKPKQSDKWQCLAAPLGCGFRVLQARRPA